jgi:hypothetical protein
LSRESIDVKRTITEELQSSLLALQMDHDSLLSQIRATEAEIQALRSHFAVLEAHALSVDISTFSDQDRSRLDLLELEINDSTGAFKKWEHKLAGLSNKLESGGGVDFHGFTFAYDGELVQWFTDRNGKISIFADAVAILNSIGANVVMTQEATQDQEAAKKIAPESELEAYVRASFNTLLPAIMVGNKKETLGGAYECLNTYIKEFDVWYPRGSQGSTGLRYRIRQGTTTVTGRLKKLWNKITTNSELIETTVYLSSDPASCITEILEYITTQYEEYV